MNICWLAGFKEYKVEMSIIYQSRRAYGILGDYNSKVYICSNCKHKLTYEDRTLNHCPYCGEKYEIPKSSAEDK